MPGWSIFSTRHDFSGKYIVFLLSGQYLLDWKRVELFGVPTWSNCTSQINIVIGLCIPPRRPPNPNMSL
jgi:hypothetical protein